MKIAKMTIMQIIIGIAVVQQWLAELLVRHST
jgi:hypothetical protein